MDANETPRTGFAAIRDIVFAFARSIAAIIAGLAITFTQNHSNVTGLTWMLIVVAVSLATVDGPRTFLNRAAWWVCLLVFVITGVGLLNGPLSAPGTLSLIMALAAFETTRAFARRDRVWGVSTAVLVIALSIVYFTIPGDSPTPSGLIGAWAIVAGVFSAIAAVDAIFRRSRGPRPTTPATTRNTTTKTARSTGNGKATDSGTKR